MKKISFPWKSGTAWVLVAVFLACGCTKKTTLRSSRRYARSWNASLETVFDDELDDKSLIVLRSEEQFAVEAKELIRKRIESSDLIIRGEVQNVADMIQSDGVTRRGVLVRIKDMLLGEKEALPQDSRELLSMFLAEDHPAFSAESVVGRDAIVFLRWLPGKGQPAFRWHANVGASRLEEIIERILQEREAEKAAKETKK